MRIVIVDGEAQVREELEKLLKKAEPEYELAGTASDGREGYELISGEFVRLPLDTKEVTEEQRASIEKLIERFEEDDDVVNVFHNMQESDEEEAE